MQFAPEIQAAFTLGAQIEARARHPQLRDRIPLRHEERSWTFREYRDEAVRYAHFLLGRLGDVDDENPGHVAMLMENHLELLALLGGCGYAELDGDGKIFNYAEAVGEICRVADDTSLFQGYYDNAGATSDKYREGIYHSGDLGHILVRDGRRFLFFDGLREQFVAAEREELLNR